MTAYHPTRKEIELLYRNKGHRAVIWYAWRNVLRILPLLEDISFKQVFLECRLAMVIANNLTVNKSIIKSAKIIRSTTSTDTIRAAVNTLIYTDIADTSDAAEATAAYTSEAYGVDASYGVKIATREDYNFLINNSERIESCWFSQPLWSTNTSVSEKFNINLQQFLNQLKDLGLAFLASDLKLIYGEKKTPKKKHWKQYLKNPSDVVFESSSSLYRFIFEESDEIKAVRILLLGPGGAGKTTLADRLQGVKKIEQHPATVGINYLSHEVLNLDDPQGGFADLVNKEDLQLFLWDFGGQTLFYGLHQAFMHENCVYILVVDSRHEQEPDEWLQQIRHIAKSEILPPVLIIINEYDNCQNTQNQNRLRQLYKGHLEFFYFRCNDPEDKRIKKFKQYLLNIAATTTKSANKNVLEAGEKLKEKLYINPVLSRAKLLTLLSEYLPSNYSDKEKEVVVIQLERLGYLVKTKKKSRDYCLNPTWTIDHAYQFLHLDCVQYAKIRGVVDIDTFETETYKLSLRLRKKSKRQKNIPQLNENSLSFLHDFLNSSGVCIALNDNKNLFFPDVAATNEPKSYINLIGSEKAFFEFLLPYFPFGLSARLVNYWMQDKNIHIATTNDVWREGFVLRDRKNKENFLIVHYFYRKAVISITCFGEKYNISRLISKFWKGLKILIEPINEADITVLPRLDKLILNEKKHLIKATEWLQSAESITYTLESMKQQNDKIKYLKKERTIVTKINYNAPVGQASVGDGNEFKQENITYFTLQSEHHKIILLQAIPQIYVDYGHKMELKHRQELTMIEEQITKGNIEKNLYDKVLPHINTVSGVVSAIAGVIGLL